ISGRNAAPQRKVKRILLMMTLLLLVAATLAFTGKHELPGLQPDNDDVLITMLVVTAMAMQNSIHRFIKGPMTTVMTGTVMNTTARFVSRHVLHIAADPQQAPAPQVKPFVMIAAFALGCVIAGFLTVKFGLASIIVPAGLLCLVTAFELRNRQQPD
ncbi:MAG TPA: YoaK family protein, partial [Xanthomonadales bacterium]